MKEEKVFIKKKSIVLPDIMENLYCVSCNYSTKKSFVGMYNYLTRKLLKYYCEKNNQTNKNPENI